MPKPMPLSSCIKGGDAQGKPGWLIQIGYDAAFLERFKRAIHHTGREWRPDAKTWWVSDQYEDALDELFGNWYAMAKLQGSLF